MDKLSTLYESVLATEKGPGDVYKQGLFTNKAQQDIVFGKHTLVSGHSIVKMPYEDAMDRNFISTPTQNTLNQLVAYGFKFVEVVFYSTLSSYRWAPTRTPKVGTLFYGTDKTGTEIVYDRSYDAMDEAKIYTKDRSFLVRHYLTSIAAGGVEKTEYTDKEIISWLIRPQTLNRKIPSREGVDWTYENGILDVITPCILDLGSKAKPVVKIGLKTIPLRSQIPYKFGKFTGYLGIGKYVTDLSNMPHTIVEGVLRFKGSVPNMLGSPLKRVDGSVNIEYIDWKNNSYAGKTFSLAGFPQVDGGVMISVDKDIIKNLIGLPSAVDDLSIHEYNKKASIQSQSEEQISNISLNGLPFIKKDLYLHFLLKKGELKKAAVGDKVGGKVSVLAPDPRGDYNMIEINKYLFTNKSQ